MIIWVLIFAEVISPAAAKSATSSRRTISRGLSLEVMKVEIPYRAPRGLRNSYSGSVLGQTPELNMQEIFPPKLLGQADGPIAKLVFQDVAIQSRRSSISGGSDHSRFG